MERDRIDERVRFPCVVDINFTTGVLFLVRIWEQNNRRFTRTYSIPFECGFNEVSLREFLKNDIPAPSIIRPDGSESG